MRLIIKLVRANEKRKTRFHTERGELMSLRAFLRIPRAIWSRFSGKYKRAPWIVPDAVSWLNQEILESWRILELGSGWSTIWYAQRCKHLVSLEHSKRWYQVTEHLLRERGVENCELRFATLGHFAEIVGSFPDHYFDLIVVDSSESEETHRGDVLKASTPKVKPGGYVLLDDSDRQQFRKTPRYLGGWTTHTFVGVKPYPLMAVETTIFQRPLEEDSNLQDPFESYNR